MINPWLNLTQTEPYLLDSDKNDILIFNNKAEDKYKIHFELLPEPFLGNPNSDIILLNLNPGYSVNDIQFHQNNNYFIGRCRENLIHAKSEYPFYLLDSKIADSPGHKWWSKKLKPLIDVCDLKKVAKDVCCIEFFPYHSKKFKNLKKPIESQEYNFYLVREAIKRNAIIIIMRAKNLWLEAVPELKEYKYYLLNSSLNVTISRKNLPKGFDEVIEKLKM